MQPKVFLSYSWKNTDIADIIDKDWQAVGITLTRDVRDLTFKQNIKDFMKRVRKSDFVLLLISKAYLESKNCMYEALEMFEDHEFKRKILPILTEDAKISDVFTRVFYIQYWETKCQVLNEHIKQINNPVGVESILHELATYNKIRASIDKFSDEIQSILCASWPHVQQERYADIFNHIGYSKSEGIILEECSRIINMSNEEEQEIAIEELEEKHKNNFYVMSTKSSLNYNNKKYKKAKLNLEKTISIYPKSVQSHYNLAILLEDHFNDYTRAKSLFEAALAIRPDYAPALNGLAGILRRKFNDYDQARQYYERAIEARPDYADTYNNYGILLKENLHAYPEAQKQYERALELNPDHANANYNLAILLTEITKNYDEAKKHYERAITTEPEHIGANYNLGNLLKDHFKDYQGARRQYERVIEIDPKHLASCNNLGMILFRHLENPIAAKEKIEYVLSIDPQHIGAHRNLALILKEHNKDYESAKQHYEYILLLNSTDFQACLRLGDLLSDHFDDEYKAQEFYKKAIDIKSDSFDATYNFAISLENSGNYDKAQEYYRQALVLRPDIVHTYDSLSRILINHFEGYDEAQQLYEKSLEIAPDNIIAHNNIAVLFKIFLNDPQKALEHYATACKLDFKFKTLERDIFFNA